MIRIYGGKPEDKGRRERRKVRVEEVSKREERNGQRAKRQK